MLNTQQRLTMILAILIIAYKKINNIKGFKIAKLKFELELENEIINNSDALRRKP